MAGIAPSGTTQPGPTAKKRERRAAGIYGAIVTAALLAAVGGRLPTDALVVSVVVTLLVYWVAEEYAETWPSRRRVGSADVGFHTGSPGRDLADGQRVLRALLALLLARLAGASSLAAANVGLVAATVLLVIHGWSAGRRRSCTAGGSSWRPRWPRGWGW